ncbi:centrosomal protein of 128 kDa, partial [Biomphalaria glabrata]
DAQKEKAKIEERYRRLQDTLKSLQQDLKSGSMDIGKKGSGVLRSTSPNGILRSSSPNGILRSSSPNGILRSSSPNGILRSSSPSSNGRKKNHVRISACTPTKEFNSEDPVTQCHTPPPLSLSDEEFRARFIPRTPTEPDSWG